jgi:molybdopterin/thiamine biosynthesis adenylyltransferase/rhodanese-related sulfurtransferase
VDLWLLCFHHFLEVSMAVAYNQDRYSRHLLLKGFGGDAQSKLTSASVLMIGAGGLGCPALQYLAAAGVGEIGIVDDDVVSLSNLQRQVLYRTQDIGKKKASVAAAQLLELNPEIRITPYLFRLDTSNAIELFSRYDIIVDGTDNFATRYLINDACVILEKPLVFAAVFQYEGQLAVFNVPDAAGIKTNYRDLFESPPSAADAPDCNEAGVLGVLPGTMGVMQATEVIKLITGLGKPLINKLLIYQALEAESYTVSLQPSQQATALAPQTAEAFQRMDYEWFCNATINQVAELDPDTFETLTELADVKVVDVREFGEYPRARFKHTQIPLSLLLQEIPAFEEARIVVFCQSGKRSLQAAALIKEMIKPHQEVYSLKGGILAL